MECQHLITRSSRHAHVATSPAPNYVTQSQFNAGMSVLGNIAAFLPSLLAQQSYSSNATPPLGGGSSNTIALANRINALSDVTISNSTIDNGSIPDLSGTYLSLSGGGTITGGTTFSNATSTNFFATNASTTNATSTTLFSVLGNFTSGIFNSLSAAVATITNLTTTGITTTNATTTNATTTNEFDTTLTATNSTINSLNVKSTLSSPNATIGALTATTSLAVYGTSSFGGTATSTIDAAGNIRGAGTLNLAGLGNFTTGFVSQASSTVAGNFTNTGFINTNGTTGGYEIDGTVILQASSTLSSVFVGQSAGNASMGSGASNDTARGTYAFNTNTTGYNNTAVGYGTLFSNTIGNNNTTLGYLAGRNITTGSQNLILGYYPTSASSITTGSDNILLGDDVHAGLTQTASNQLNIGNLIFGTNVGTGATLSTGNVGIGTASPQTTLQINQSANVTPSNYHTYPFSVSNQTSAASVTIGADATYAYLQSWGEPLEINNQGNNTVLNPTSGNVGIGTTTPFAKLSVQGAGTGTGVNFQTTNSSQAPLFSILDNGNVGIGTANPTSPYESFAPITQIAGTFPAISLSKTSGTNRIWSMGINTGGIFQIVDETGSAVRATFDTSGNVGIGTATPGAKLQVSGGTLTGTAMSSLFRVSGATIGDTVGSEQSLASFGLQSSGGSNEALGIHAYRAIAGTDWTGVEPIIGMDVNSVERAGSYLVFGQFGVGIGTTTAPAASLSINGLIGGALSSSFRINAGALNTTTGSDVNIASLGFTAGSNNIALGIHGYRFSNGTDWNSTGILLGVDVDAVTRPGGSGIALLNTGNVGIGTTSPFAKLSVQGAGTGTGINFQTTNSSQTPLFSILDNGNATLAGCLNYNGGTSGTCLSDERVKQDITPFGDGLKEIVGLNPVTYEYNGLAGTPNDGDVRNGLIAQQVQQIAPDLVSTTSALLNASDTAPTQLLEVNYSALTFALINAVKEIASISGTFQQTLIAWLGNSANGITDLFAKNLYATNVTADNLTANQKLCVGSTCVTPSQFQAMVAAAGQSTSGSSPLSDSGTVSSTPETPPIIQINGNNPAIIHVGDTYNDLGATITGPIVDLNLDIQTYLNGTLVSPIVIDTSSAATDTIDYVVTDPSGLTSTSTRTVLIQAPANDNVPAASNDNQASTTAATSTGQ